MKKNNEDFICAYCELATVGEDGAVFCKKKKKEIPPDGVCRAFSYDLLKRPASPKPTVTTLDPSLFE